MTDPNTEDPWRGTDEEADDGDWNPSDYFCSCGRELAADGFCDVCEPLGAPVEEEYDDE